MYTFKHNLSLSQFSRVKTLALSYDVSKIAFYALLGLILSMGIVYAYLLNQTVLSVVERKDMEERAEVLAAELAELEFAYMEKKNDVTLEYAQSIGMTEVASKSFVRQNSGSLLTLRD